MDRPQPPITARRQVLLLHAKALGLTPNALDWRIRHWGPDAALATPRRPTPRKPTRQTTTMARAIEQYYEEHPEKTPPWERPGATDPRT